MSRRAPSWQDSPRYRESKWLRAWAKLLGSRKAKEQAIEHRASHSDRHREDPRDLAAPVSVRDGRSRHRDHPRQEHPRAQDGQLQRAVVHRAFPGAPDLARRAHHRVARADRRHPRLRERAVRFDDEPHVLPRHRQGEVPPARSRRATGSTCSSRSCTTAPTSGSSAARPPSTARSAPRASSSRRSSIATCDE